MVRPSAIGAGFEADVVSFLSSVFTRFVAALSRKTIAFRRLVIARLNIHTKPPAYRRTDVLTEG